MNSDSSISKSENKDRNAKKTWCSGILLLLLLFFIILGAACCHFFPWFTSTKPDNPPQEVKVADIETATIYLETLSRRAVYFSVQHGGNGKISFPANIGDIYSAIPTKLKKAIISDTIDNPIPIDGYLFKMKDCPDGQSFYFEAIPAEGFQGKIVGITPTGIVIDNEVVTDSKFLPSKTNGGDSICDSSNTEQQPPSNTEQPPSNTKWPPQSNTNNVIPVTVNDFPHTTQKDNSKVVQAKHTQTQKNVSKKERIASFLEKIKDDMFGEKTNHQDPGPRHVQLANIDAAKMALKTLARRAIYYSVRHGGNGQKNFPTNITQIAEYIPEQIKRAVVFLNTKEDKALPLDGYIFKMLPSKTEDDTDFCFVAFPAEYFRGPTFDVDKSGKIQKR